MSHTSKYKVAILAWAWQGFARTLKTGCFVLYCCCLSTSVYAETILIDGDVVFSNGRNRFAWPRACSKDKPILDGQRCRNRSELCRPGYKGVGPVCWKQGGGRKTVWACKGKKDCPAGFRRKSVCTCDNISYGRGVGEKLRRVSWQGFSGKIVRCSSTKCEVVGSHINEFIEDDDIVPCRSCQHCEVTIPERTPGKTRITWTCEE